jgi:hypothetical protein
MAEHKEFSVWLVQIERFLERENYLDAIARAGHLVEEAQRAFEARPEDERLGQLLARGRERLATATEAFEKKNKAVADRRLSAMRSAPES